MELPDFKTENKALFDAIDKVVPPSMNIYLVGGAVRDIVLGRQVRDYDFCCEGLVRPIGKHIADELGGAYYVLDDERDMVRAIVDDEQMGQFDIDIALISGEDISEDLRERDFTFNAMAIKIGENPVFVDPLNGLADLQQKKLRMCGPESLNNDPMRALRAIRMSLEFGLEMDEGLLDAMMKIHDRLPESSMERYRDEMFKIIRLYQNDDAVRMYQQFNFLSYLFPGMEKKDSDLDLGWVKNTDSFALLLTQKQDLNKISDDYALYASSRLGNFQEALRAFFDKTLALYHNRLMLMAFTAIVKTLSDDVETVKNWCRRLTFSSSEMNFVESAFKSHTYLNSLSDVTTFSDVDIYRYFGKYKEGGVAGLVLFLSQAYAMRDIPHAYKEWCDKVVFVQALISAYFTRYMEVISPTPLLSGHNIQELLNIPAGPNVGAIKNSLIEAQIRGSVKTLSEAESFVRQQAKHYV